MFKIFLELRSFWRAPCCDIFDQFCCIHVSFGLETHLRGKTQLFGVILLNIFNPSTICSVTEFWERSWQGATSTPYRRPSLRFVLTRVVFVIVIFIAEKNVTCATDLFFSKILVPSWKHCSTFFFFKSEIHFLSLCLHFTDKVYGMLSFLEKERSIIIEQES